MDDELKGFVEKAQTIDDLAESLEALLNSGCVIRIDESGEQRLLYTRALVDNVNGLKIQIFADEHAPPHFHVTAPDIDAAFTIADCKLLRGQIDSKTQKLIIYWHKKSHEKLNEIWNRTRPSDCPVGPIKETS
jgi:Domain of unknown function (DUF4160)